jgi:hypothetical protein
LEISNNFPIKKKKKKKRKKGRKKRTTHVEHKAKVKAKSMGPQKIFLTSPTHLKKYWVKNFEVRFCLKKKIFDDKAKKVMKFQKKKGKVNGKVKIKMKFQMGGKVNGKVKVEK